MDIRAQIAALYAEGWTQTEIAHRLHYCQGHISYLLPRGSAPKGRMARLRETDAKIADALRQGMTMAEAARHLSMSRHTLRSRVWSMRRRGMTVRVGKQQRDEVTP